MDMSDMGGMDMGSSGLFKATNTAIAQNYWVIVAVIVGMLGIVRVIDSCRNRWRYVCPSSLFSTSHIRSSD